MLRQLTFSKGEVCGSALTQFPPESSTRVDNLPGLRVSTQLHEERGQLSSGILIEGIDFKKEAGMRNSV
jgi:hypothetical protein